VPAGQLKHMLGITDITLVRHHLSLSDTTLA
jgi:hypothetical protein